MFVPRHCTGRRRPAGLTLLEMLLVLAILTAALAVLYPATERLYRTHRFQQSLEEVRAKLAATRVRAIDDGLIYQFQYEPEGRRLLVIAHGLARDATNRAATSGVGTQRRPDGWRFSGELASGLRFGPQEDPGERVSAERLTEFSDATELAATTWSAPVLFFPDGSATDADIRIVDPDGRQRRISVRGLTGAASIESTGDLGRN